MKENWFLIVEGLFCGFLNVGVFYAAIWQYSCLHKGFWHAWFHLTLEYLRNKSKKEYFALFYGQCLRLDNRLRSAGFLYPPDSRLPGRRQCLGYPVSTVSIRGSDPGFGKKNWIRTLYREQRKIVNCCPKFK